MNGIVTTFEIEVKIDNTPFTVVASSPSKEAKEELENSAEGLISMQTRRADIFAELEYLQKDYELNEEILKHSSLIDKAKGYLQQKERNDKIYALQKEAKALTKELEELNITLEDIHAKRFELLIGGRDKAALKAEVLQKNIPFMELNSYINELIARQKEKNDKALSTT